MHVEKNTEKQHNFAERLRISGSLNEMLFHKYFEGIVL